MDFFIVAVIVTIGIVLFYLKREEDEELLGFKLVGYYILGIFYFNLSGLVIPLGFIISLFLKPRQNKGVKRVAAIFGLVMMIIGLLIT